MVCVNGTVLAVKVKMSDNRFHVFRDENCNDYLSNGITVIYPTVVLVSVVLNK